MICGGSGSACGKRVVTRTALRDGLLEQSVGAGAGHQCGDTETPGRFTRNSDAIWITTKSGDVVLHPLQRSNLIQRAVDVRCGEFVTQVSEVSKAQCPKSIVDGHDNDVVVLGESRAVVPRDCALPTGVPAAVNPHHYRSAAGIVFVQDVRWGRNVQVQTVFTPPHRGTVGHAAAGNLGRSRRKLQRGKRVGEGR